MFSKKMKKLSYTIFAATTLMGVSSSAHAQWAVFDGAAYALQTILNEIVSSGQSAVKGSIDTVRSAINIQMEQDKQFHLENESFMRKALGDNSIMNKDISKAPSKGACVAAASSAGFAVVNENGLFQSMNLSARISGWDDSGQKINTAFASPTAYDTNAYLGSFTSMITKDRANPNSSTCSKEEVERKVTSCAQVGQYPHGDYDVSYIKQNMKMGEAVSIAKGGAKFSGKMPANYSIGGSAGNEGGIEVAMRYIFNVVYGGERPSLPQKANTLATGRYYDEYMRYYMTFYGRLSTAHDSLINVAKSRISVPSAYISSHSMGGAFVSWWNNKKTDYANIMNGRLAPDRPSEFEMINYMVTRNMMGVVDENSNVFTADSGDLAKMTWQQMALNNYLQWRHIQLAEDTNTMLAALLSQNMEPITSTYLKQLKGPEQSIVNKK